MIAPPGPALSEFRNLLTGEVVTAESVNGRRVLSIAKVLHHAPIAVLERLS